MASSSVEGIIQSHQRTVLNLSSDIVKSIRDVRSGSEYGDLQGLFQQLAERINDFYLELERWRETCLNGIRSKFVSSRVPYQSVLPADVLTVKEQEKFEQKRIVLDRNFIKHQEWISEKEKWLMEQEKWFFTFVQRDEETIMVE